MTPDQVALLHELIKNRTVLNVNGVDVSIAHASLDHFVVDLAVLVHKLKDMENLQALLVAVRMGDRVFLVGRSRLPEVHVGEIFAEFGGGGHAFAASGTVRDLTMVQILERLPDVLRRHVNPLWEARHLMSSPVKSVNASDTIGDVRKTLTRYNINSLPVMDDGEMAGIITRQVADKAAHHGLGKIPVREYMSREFASVTPDASVESLKELIVGNNQRFVPVFEEGRLAGAITRTDLLRHMVAGVRANHRQGAGNGNSELIPRKRSVARLLRDQLPPPILKMLQDMGQVGDALGMNIFAVGGFVRDLLLRQENLDVDIVVEGEGIAFATEYAKQHECRVRAHRKFGTAVIIFPDGFKVDVASTRMEYYLEPGALPTVEHASIKLDLYRRDFTINTLALAINGEHYGDLHDFFGGQRDLEERAIRVLHNLSFVEDPTRMFRAIRFEQRLGFHMGVHTEQLLRSAVRMGFLDKVGGGRVFNELVLIFMEADPLPAVLRMAELDLLKYIHPSLAGIKKARPLFEAASQALHWHALLYTGETCRRWLVYFLCLTASLDRDAIEGVCSRLSITARYRMVVAQEREESHRVLQDIHRYRSRGRTPRASQVYRWLTPFSTETLLYLMASAGHEEVRRWISQYFTRLAGASSILTGSDLKRMGLPPGPRYREILDGLLDARLNGKVVTREDEVALVKKRFLRSAPKT
ncbi:CBS domain-containing protein [Desulfuromonas sp.]|uniref:CBS domain-containing protein n=1 Tax=Desulfuromonas sp. TaxID=892 RepID=UPI0025C49B10|nr:CBS domain-containing protein [Desulfuromonas sp.]